MKKFLIAAALMLASIVLLSQQNPNVIWSKVYGGNDSDGGVKLIPLDNGEIIGIGQSFSSDSLVNCSNGYRDGIIFKIDQNGGLMNENCIGGSGDDILMEGISYNDSEIFVCGSSNSINGGFINNHGSYDAFVAKLDTNLNLKWIKTFGGTLDDVLQSAIKIDYDKIALLGSSGSTDFDLQGISLNGYSGAWLLILDSNGNIISNNRYGGTNAGNGYSISKGNDGKIVLVGKSVDASNLKHLFLAKTDSIGNLIWSHEYGTTLDWGGRSVALDSQLNIYTLAYCNGNDPLINNFHGGLSDCAILKFDSGGNVIWSKCFGGSDHDDGVNLFIKNNHLFAIGNSKSHNGDLQHNNGLDDAWVFEVSQNGVLENSLSFGSSLSDGASYLICTQDSNFVFIGMAGAVDEDVNSPIILTPPNIWVCKFKQEILGINLLAQHSIMIIYNNPSTGVFQLFNSSEQEGQITIYTISGIKVLATSIQTKEKLDIDLAAFDTNIFLLRFEVQNNTEFSKLIKQN